MGSVVMSVDSVGIVRTVSAVFGVGFTRGLRRVVERVVLFFFVSIDFSEAAGWESVWGTSSGINSDEVSGGVDNV